MTKPNAPLISIVDDDELARDGISVLVDSFGYEAIPFRSAEHFLQSDMIAETTCLITDVQMPGLSGLELQESLQSQRNYTPVIVITAYPTEKDRTRALENGAVAYLSKPFEEHTLIECLTTAINSQSTLARHKAQIEQVTNSFNGITPRQTIDALPAAIYVTDSKGYITYFNDAAAALWGRRPALHSDQWCGSWRLYRLDGTLLPHDQCPMATALKQGRPIRGRQAIAERPDGTRVAFMPFPTPLYDASGALVGAVNMLIESTSDAMPR
jgi:FixJ family two-component response regulator